MIKVAWGATPERVRVKTSVGASMVASTTFPLSSIDAAETTDPKPDASPDPEAVSPSPAEAPEAAPPAPPEPAPGQPTAEEVELAGALDPERPGIHPYLAEAAANLHVADAQVDAGFAEIDGQQLGVTIGVMQQ